VQATVSKIPIRLGFLAMLALSALGQGAAWAQTASRGASLETDLALIETEVVGLERRVGSLRADVSGGALSRSPRFLTERFNEAQYAYLVEDYERCALIFYSLLDRDDLKGDPRRPEAQWYLAECLYLDGNLVPAQSSYRNIVDSGNTHPFYGDSLLKLIEIYGRTGDVNQFNFYYNNFSRSMQDGSPTALRIRYEMGKTLYRQGKLPESQQLLGAFPRGSTYTPQAGYFAAAIAVADAQRDVKAGESAEIIEQKYRRAITLFRETLALPTSTPEHTQVMDLCHLGVARLEYELGNVPAAVSEYQLVPNSSVYYSDALYEMIWANIEAAGQETIPTFRLQKFEEALRTIEIFNLAFPDDRREPALRLLGGHVRVRMEQYDEAIDRYKEAAGQFRELKQVVDQIVGSGADPMVYFNQLVDDKKYVAEADLTVPPPARLQARSDERVTQTVRVAGELYRQREDIGKADDLLDILEEALFASGSEGLLQTYRIHRQNLDAAEASALLLRSRLVEVEMAYLDSSVPAAQRPDVQAVRADYDSAQQAASGVAMERQEDLELASTLELQARAVGTRIYNLELLVNDLRSRLLAVEEYLVTARAKNERSKEQEREARQIIDQERAVITEVEEGIRQLRKRAEPRVLTARIMTQVAGGGDNKTSDARGRMSGVESRLAGLRRYVASGGDFFRRLDAARSRLLDLDRIAGETRNLMTRSETAEVDDIKREVEFQRRMVASLDQEGTSIGDANTAVSGRIGRQAFVNVANFYEDMLTRADMGVIDVFWYRKEARSKERKDLAREKVKRLKALEEAFSTVLEGSEEEE
jgi:tetratricopeptide (TPR) repeat protein